MVPFWVVAPKENDRETCLCKLHENIQLVTNKLKILSLVETNNVDNLLDTTVCDRMNKACMYGECETCKDRDVMFAPHDHNKPTTYIQWQTKKEEREIKRGEMKKS